jgi:hypothetical protein
LNVTLKVLSPLWANRSAYAYPIAQFEYYTGSVLPSPSWVDQDSVCIGTGNKRFPFRVIERARIVEYSEAKVALNVSKPETFVKQKKFFTNIANRARMNNRLKTGNGPLPKSGEVNMAKVKSTTSVEKHGDKTRIAIEIMEANVGRSYDEVSQLIADAIGVDIGRARVYYRHKVINGIAKGYNPNVRPWESKVRTATAQAPKVAKPTKAKLEKSVRAINAATKAKAKAELNVDEIAKIKEANLARMKEVSAKLKPKGKVRDYGTRVAEVEGAGVADFDPTLAYEEVQSILRDERLIDVCPKFVREDV